MLETYICVAIAIGTTWSVLLWKRIKKLTRSHDQVASNLLTLVEFLIPHIKFYTDCHQYNLLTLQLYLIRVMKSAAENENFELAKNCKKIIVEMDKLIHLSDQD